MPTISPARDSAKPRPGPDRVASYTKQIGRGGASCLTHEVLALPAHPPGLALGLRRRESLGMTMSVHDALEAWAEGRLPVEQALALTGEHSVADLLVLCALCDVPRPLLAGPPDPADIYPVEDGPGSGRRVELTVRVLIGTARSTVIGGDPVTGRALAHQVVQHGAEADTAAAVVASLVRDGIAEGCRDD